MKINKPIKPTLNNISIFLNMEAPFNVKGLKGIISYQIILSEKYAMEVEVIDTKNTTFYDKPIPDNYTGREEFRENLSKVGIDFWREIEENTKDIINNNIKDIIVKKIGEEFTNKLNWTNQEIK